MSRSGRSGTGARPYRRNRAILLATTPDLCAICGHGDAQTADHIISAKFWPRGPDGKYLPGLDDLSNLQRAHGTLGAGRGRLNRCPVCQRLCNQSRGSAGRIPRPCTRKWL